MSHTANDYVKKLFRDKVSRRQKLVLWSLADYHNTSQRAAWPSMRTLAEESLMDIRECRRVLDELEAIELVQRIKGGAGPGDFNRYRLVELDGKDGHMTPLSKAVKDGGKDGRKGGSEGGQNRYAIRKEREPEREPISPLPPPQGGKAELTPRERQKLGEELSRIYQGSVGAMSGTDFDEEALGKACIRLCLPLELARKAVAESMGQPLGVTRRDPE